MSSLCVTIKCDTALCGDNLRMIISCTNPDLELKSKYMSISCHKLQDCVEARVVNSIKVCTTVIQVNILTKRASLGTMDSLSDASYGMDKGNR